MKNYHAHIYFDLHQRAIAENVVSNLLEMNLPDLKLWKFHENKVGPHFFPMAEVHFTENSLSEVLKCLKLYHDGISILVHEDSGDDFRDHENPIWVGPSLPIDFDFFHKVKEQPSLSMH
jgi:aromatic ring-cleaving dioxygenase